MKRIQTRNSKGKLHGYQEWYNGDALLFRATFKADKPMGYIEWSGNDKHVIFNIQ